MAARRSPKSRVAVRVCVGLPILKGIEMPLYVYKCSKCGHKLEELQKFSDEPLKKCPKCKKNALEKQLSADTGFCLMGYGWHKPGMSAPKKK